MALQKIPPVAHYKPKYHYNKPTTAVPVLKGKAVQQRGRHPPKVDMVCTKMIRSLKKEEAARFQAEPLRRHDAKEMQQRRLQSAYQHRLPEQVAQEMVLTNDGEVVMDSQDLDQTKKAMMQSSNAGDDLNDRDVALSMTLASGNPRTVQTMRGKNSAFHSRVDGGSLVVRSNIENTFTTTRGKQQSLIRNKVDLSKTQKPADRGLEESLTNTAKGPAADSTGDQEHTASTQVMALQTKNTIQELSQAEILKRHDKKMIKSLGFDSRFKYPNVSINHKYHIVQVKRPLRTIMDFNPE